MKNSKKVAALGLSLAVGAMLFSSALIAVPVASAQSTSSVQQQINALMAEIDTLKASLGTSSGSSSADACYDFTSNLTVGSTGAQVGALQQLLIDGGYLTAVSAPTNYFGSLTQAALAKWQAANNVSPAVGYFGPITRGAIAQDCTTAGSGSGNTGTGNPAPTGTGLSVSLDANSPAAGNIALGAVATPLLALDFTAGSAPQEVTSLTVQRSGLSQDADLQNVYLYEGGNRLATDQSISNGMITFTNSNGLFTVNAGQTDVIWVSADIFSGSNGSNAGHIITIALPASSDVVTASGVTTGGTFPITGQEQNLVYVSNLATLTFQDINSTTTVNAGQTNNLVGQFTLTAGNDPVKVENLNFTLTGSVPTQDITNIVLSDSGTQEGATLASLNGNVATFNLSGAPLMLASGQSATLSLYANVTGGVGDYFQFTVQRASDVQAIDNTYNVGIGATQNGQAAGVFNVQNMYYVTVAQGGLVVNAASSTALYAIQNNSNTILGNYTVLASGDNIRLTTLVLELTGSATTTNVQVLINGAQLGTTQTTMTTGVPAEVTFSNLNYIIPANSTQTLTIEGTVTAGTSVGSSVTVTGQSQSNYSTVGPVTQSSPVLTVLSNSSNLVGYQNSSFGTPVLAAGSSPEIASYILQAGQVNSVLLSGVAIAIPSGITSGWLSNLYVTVNGTAVGTAQGNVVASGQYTFSASQPIVIPATNSVTVNVYASISNSTTTNTGTDLANLASVNATAGSNSVSITAVSGQNVTISQGQTLAAITLDPTTPAVTSMGMSTTANTLAVYRLVGSTQGPVTVTQITVRDAASSATTTINSQLGAFNNFTVVAGGNVLAAQQSLNTSGSATGTATFVFSTPVVVPQNQYATISLVGNTANYNSATASEATTHSFQAVSYAASLTTGATTTSTGVSANGNNITLYRTLISGFSAGSIPSQTTAIGVGNLDSAFNVGAGSTGDVFLQSVTLSQSGSVVQASTTMTFNLIDASNPSVNLTTSTVTISSSTPAVVYFAGTNGTGTGDAGFTGWDVPAGAVHTLELKLTSSANTLAATNNNGTYQVSITALKWGDGTTGDLTVLPSTITFPIAGPVLSGLSD